MGFNSGSNMMYCGPKGGQLVQHKKGGEIIKLGFSFTGKLKKIREKADEYQGQPLNKVELIMDDLESKEGRTVCIQFIKDSWFSHGFFARAAGIDLNKPLIVGCSSSEKNEKITFCWLKQGAETIKKDENFPKPDKVNFGGKVMGDWSKVTPVMDLLIADINSKLGGALKGGTVVEPDADTPF